MIIVHSTVIISIKFKVYWQTIGNHLPLAINIYMYTKRNCEENEKKAQIHKIANK